MPLILTRERVLHTFIPALENEKFKTVEKAYDIFSEDNDVQVIAYISCGSLG